MAVGAYFIVAIVVASLGGPNPNEVVYASLAEVVEHILPNLLVDLGSLASPPEPSTIACVVSVVAEVTSGFVEWAPQHSDASILQSQQSVGNHGQFGVANGALPCALLEHVRWLKDCFFVAGCHLCGARWDLISFCWHHPMPRCSNETSVGSPLFGLVAHAVVNYPILVVPIGAVGVNLDEVHGGNGGIFACGRLY